MGCHPSKCAPQEDAFIPPTTPVTVAPDLLARYAGHYRFGPNAILAVAAADGQLSASLNKFGFYDLRKDKQTRLIGVSDSDFYIAGRYHTRLSLVRDAAGKIIGATINPGPWQQAGIREGD